jgi:hypothetical protein
MVVCLSCWIVALGTICCRSVEANEQHVSACEVGFDQLFTRLPSVREIVAEPKETITPEEPGPAPFCGSL